MMSGMLAKAIRQEKSIWNGKEVMFNVEYKTPKESIKNLLEILSISLQDSRSIYQISNHISIEWKAKIRENYPIYKNIQGMSMDKVHMYSPIPLLHAEAGGS